LHARFVCPQCSIKTDFDLTNRNQILKCSNCLQKFSLTGSHATKKSGVIDNCWVCGSSRFYLQKDIKPVLGFVIVGVTILISSIVLIITRNTIFSFLVLAMAAIVDLVLYKILPDVTICYSCETEYRKLVNNPAHIAFDLHISESYRGYFKPKRISQ